MKFGEAATYEACQTRVDLRQLVERQGLKFRVSAVTPVNSPFFASFDLCCNGMISPVALSSFPMQTCLFLGAFFSLSQ